jgi:hypothetical protein
MLSAAKHLGLDNTPYTCDASPRRHHTRNGTTAT